ncbi:BREX-1 system phosphatase PglZ type A [Butyrivibrio sp. AE2015]|uniref:BREX-1 system phosphatase PglZ type A n=1 Tax=Butyrivibrio sp. AE2015 TaxID=1280663 RepID=UPI0003B5E5EC|nr:BREX-1 system phosphatase PglZ type A [Butyrivibrio sp. AE2015]
MDLATIGQELNKKFNAPLPEFYKRRIIVWYDEEMEFEDQLDSLELHNAKILRLTGNNNFIVKKTIANDEPVQNFLLYCPITYETLENNWFLDVELYSEEFRADLISIWMDEMGIPSSVALRNQVKKYRKFLNAKSRRDDVVKIADSLDSPMKLQLAVMAAIGEAGRTEPIAIIKSVLKAGLNSDDNYLYQEFTKYEAVELFWSMVSSITGYSDVDHNLGKLAAHVILTASSRTLPVGVFDGLSDFMSQNGQLQAYCSDLVSDWVHSDDSVSYVNIAETVEDEMHLEKRLSKQTALDLADTEILPSVNRIILTKLMTDIKNEILEPETIFAIAEKRRSLAGFGQYEDYYNGIVALAKMEEFCKDNAVGFHIVGAKNIWKAYETDYYKMDTYYREFHMSYENSKKSYGGDLQDLFTEVCNKVERLYSNWFLDGLGHNWSEEAASELEEKGYIEGIDRQEHFYDRKVKNADNKVYVIISDALRYEVAASLKEELSREMQGKVSLSSMQGIFPTETKFGMAALLPHRELSVELKESDNGKKLLKVLADGQSSDSINRENLLRASNPESVAVKAKDLMSVSRAERSELVKGKEVVYIYHDTIDETSHTSETKVFNACEETIKEIITLVRTIVNDFGGINIMITSDHGFLYTYSPLTEEVKTEKSEFVHRIVEYARRFAILTKGDDPEYLLPVKFMEGKTDYYGYAPRGDIRIKTSAGSGMNFVHGGISLQEMCVPLIEYKHLRNSSKEYQKNKEKYDTKPVEVMLLSANHKVSNMIFSLNFYQKEAVSGNREKAVYDAYFVDATGKKISDVQKIFADKTSEDVQNRTFRCNFSLKSQAYDNKETYYLVIEQEDSTDLPQRIEFQIDIAFAADDFGFFS